MTLRRAGPPFERAPKDLVRRTMVTAGAMTKRIDRSRAAPSRCGRGATQPEALPAKWLGAFEPVTGGRETPA